MPWSVRERWWRSATTSSTCPRPSMRSSLPPVHWPTGSPWRTFAMRSGSPASTPFRSWSGWTAAAPPAGLGTDALYDGATRRHLAALRLGETAPDAIGLADLEGELEAFVLHPAHPANRLRLVFAAIAIFLALGRARGKEEVGVIAPAQALELPGAIDVRRAVQHVHLPWAPAVRDGTSGPPPPPGKSWENRNAQCAMRREGPIRPTAWCVSLLRALPNEKAGGS